MIALGLDFIVYIWCLKKKIETQKISEVHFNTGRLLLEFNASSTSLQLGKSSWPSQILLVYRLGKASTTPETQTLPAPNHTPFGSRYMPTSLHSSAAQLASSRALGIKQLGRQEGVFGSNQ